MDDLDLVTVGSYLVRYEAEIAKAVLAAAGIAAIVQADDEGGLSPGFFADHRVRLVVRRDRQDEAEALLGGSGASADSLQVDRRHLDAIVAHARLSAPLEACGLMACSPAGTVRFVYCLTNAAESAYRYTIDPTEHFGAVRHAERNEWEIGAVFHSHPTGPALPSRTDIETADPTWVHVVVGISRAGKDDVRAFRISDGEAVEIPIRVG